jgi:hypothetical protein
VPNDSPQIATADGGVIGSSGITYDSNGTPPVKSPTCRLRDGLGTRIRSRFTSVRGPGPGQPSGKFVGLPRHCCPCRKTYRSGLGARENTRTFAELRFVWSPALRKFLLVPPKHGNEILHRHPYQHDCPSQQNQSAYYGVSHTAHVKGPIVLPEEKQPVNVPTGIDDGTSSGNCRTRWSRNC